MNKLAALILVALTGCLCGGFAGGNDRVYQRNDDVLILCENGAFVVKQGGVETDGMVNAATNGAEVGTLDDTAQVVFTLTENRTAGTASAPELPGAWAAVQLDTVAIDHANLQCTRLESASWWPGTAQ